MKLTNTLRALILENSRFQVLYNKLVAPTKKGKDGKPKKSAMEFDTLKRIIFADPTTRAPENFDIEGASIDDMDQVKVGKYTQWLLKRFRNPILTNDDRTPIEYGTPEYKSSMERFKRFFLEDLERFKTLLSKFDRYKGSLDDSTKKNIDNVKSLEELAQLKVKYGDELVDLNYYRGKKIKKNKNNKVNKMYDVPGAEVLKVGENYTLIRISDKGVLGSQAASYFGGCHGDVDSGETNWCTRAENSSYSQTYRNQGPLYIVIANDDGGKVGEVSGLPSERYQIHFPTNQFKHADQFKHQFSIVEKLNNEWSDLKEYFKPEFARGLTSMDGEKLEIKYNGKPDSLTSQFALIYGLDEIFESAPKNIKNLLFINSSQEEIALDIPQSIGRFKNLDAMVLQNIVRTLPDNIDELTNLKFLSLPDNKQLESLPESLENCEELLFINLKGSNPNVKLHGKLLEKFEQEGDGFYVA